MSGATNGAAPDVARLHFALQVGVAWSSALHRSDVTQAVLEGAVTEALTELLSQLGIPAAPEVKVAISAADGSAQYESADPRLFMEAQPLRYPRDLPDRVTDGPASSADPAADVARIMVEIVKLHAPRAVTDETAAAYLASVNLSHVLPEDRALTLLQRVLGCGCSLAHRHTIAAALVEGVACGLGDDDIVENIVVRGRVKTVDVEMRAEHVQVLAGAPIDLAEPIWLRSISADAARQIDTLRQALFFDLGVRLPPIRLVARDDLPEHRVAVRINQLTGVPWPLLAEDTRFANGTAELLEEQGVPFEPAMHPGSGVLCGVISVDDVGRLHELGVQHWDAFAHMMIAIGGEVRRHAGRLIDADVVTHELGLLATTHGDVVDAALALVTVGRLTAILRLLLDGGVPIRDLRGILERVIAFDYVIGDDEGRLLLGDALVLERAYTRQPIDRAETYARYIRKTLARVISGRVAPNGTTLRVFLMGWEAEQPILSHLAHLVSAHDGTPLAATDVERLHTAIAVSIDEMSNVTSWPPIVANASVAAFLRESLTPEFPHLVVLSFEDLAPGVSLDTIKRIAFD